MSLLANTKVGWKFAVIGMNIKSEFLKSCSFELFHIHLGSRRATSQRHVKEKYFKRQSEIYYVSV